MVRGFHVIPMKSVISVPLLQFEELEIGKDGERDDIRSRRLICIADAARRG